MVFIEGQDSDGAVLQPKVLVMPRCSDAGAEINNEIGYTAYCNTLDKLGFVKEKGVAGEIMQSVEEA